MIKRILPSLLALFLSACAPTQFLKKNYAAPQLEGKSLLLYPITADKVSVLNGEDFADDFEDVKDAPAVFLKAELNDAAGRFFDENFKKVKVENVEDSAFAPLNEENSLKVTESIGKEAFEARIPKLEYLRTKNLDPAFVLVMDQVVFSRDLQSTQHVMPNANPAAAAIPGSTQSTVTTTKKSMSMGVNYVIYDYGENAVVGYGFAKGEKTFSFAMTRSDWYAAMKDALQKIKKFSPF